MTNTAIVRNCATLNEAFICRGLLQTHGIHASIDNAEHSAVDWYIVQALGGVNVRVPTSQLRDAQEAMITHVTHADELLNQHTQAYEPNTTSQRRKVIIMMVIWFGGLNAILALLLWFADWVIPREWIDHVDNCLSPNFVFLEGLHDVDDASLWQDWFEWMDECSGRNVAPPRERAVMHPNLPGGLIYAIVIAFLLSIKIALAPNSNTQEDPQI